MEPGLRLTAARGLPAEGLPTRQADGAEVLVPYIPRTSLTWLAGDPDAVYTGAEGTVLFVDVSGFTALTERLAGLGKVGAEETSDVIGSVFGELLAVSSAYGGDLLKWGGDAVLLYFAEPGSAERAARTAALMTRAMPRVGRIRTPGGRLHLGISIGAHTGVFDLYLLGALHRELIITGPAASVTARMEAAAASGEVLVSQATARRLEPSVLGDQRGEGLLLTGVPLADTAPLVAMPEVVGAAVESLFPAEKRTHLLAGGEHAEHRQAAVAFVEFSGVDRLTAEEGPAGVAAALGPIITAAQTAADRNGVTFHETDIGPDGGKVVLVGGVPFLRGNDAERLLRAARDIVAGHPPDSPLAVRAGANHGRVFVFAHEFRSCSRRVFSITGDAVNVSARVMAQARPGQVIATESILSRARHRFEVRELEALRVKGKTEPISAAVLGNPVSILDECDVAPLFGRESELSEILARADGATNGSGGLIEIVGAAGIGKSRLIGEAIRRWKLSTLRVGCEEYESATPYLPFRRVLRLLMGITDETSERDAATRLRGTVRSLVPELEPFLPLLADVVGVAVPSTPEVDELEQRFRLARLEYFVVEMLRSWLSSPAALVFEDAHAMDAASSSLLARIVGEARDLPLLVVLTRESGRSGQIPAGGAGHTLIELGPLDASALLEIARAGSEGVEPGPEALSALVERAGGNPLFLRELLRAGQGAGGGDALPDSLEPLLVAQIDMLSPEERQLLRAAAVLGNRFDADLLDDLVPGKPADNDVEAHLSGFLVVSGRGWRFAHALMRDAAYEGLSFRRRRELHGRAARAIEARAPNPAEEAEILSIHWLEAEDYERAWLYSRLAGDAAKRLWANADAAIFYERALQAADRMKLPLRDRMDVAEALGDAYELAAIYDKSRAAYARARRLCEAGVDRARLLRKLGVIHEREGCYQQALACYTRGRRLVSRASGTAVERSELDLASAGVRSRQGRYADCVRFAASAADISSSVGYKPGLAHALYLRHMMSVYLGAPVDDLARRALAIFEELGDLVGQANVLNNLGVAAYYDGRWKESLDYYARSRDARTRSGDVAGAATAENNVAEILSDQGRLEEARALFESARATWSAAHYPLGVALATSNLGSLEARTGQMWSARGLLEWALSHFLEIHSTAFCAEAELRLAECSLLEGDTDAAMAASSSLLDTVRGRPGMDQVEIGALRVLGAATRLAQLVSGVAGDSGNAGALDAAVELAAARGAKYELALALATRAELARLGGGGRSSDLERAAGIFAGLGVSSPPPLLSAQPASDR